MFEQERAFSVAPFMKQFPWRWLAGMKQLHGDGWLVCENTQASNLMYPSHGSIYKLSFFFAVFCFTFTYLFEWQLHYW